MYRNEYDHRPTTELIWLDHTFVISAAQEDVPVVLPGVGRPIWGNNITNGAGDTFTNRMAIQRVLVLYTAATSATNTGNIQLGSILNNIQYASNIFTSNGRVVGDIDTFENSVFDALKWTVVEADKTISIRKKVGTGTGSFKIGIEYILDHTLSDTYAHS